MLHLPENFESYNQPRNWWKPQVALAAAKQKHIDWSRSKL